MKKQKLLISFLILFGIIFIPFFTGCNDVKLKKSLPAPTSAEYQINLDSGRQMLYTQSHPLASGYIFGISEIKTEDYADFLQYKTDKNYFDVTNMFLNAKTYYFFAKYVGTGDYVSSENSPINSHSIQHKLDTPFITLTSTTLNWVSVNHADNYNINCEYGNKKELVATTQDTTFDLQNYINQKISTGVEEELKFSVSATARENYTRSADSNYVSYTAFLQLSVPTELSVVTSNSRMYLQWKRVDHCENYIIKANLTDLIDVKITNCVLWGNYLRYDITNVFEEYSYGDYQFLVKSNKTNNYLTSDFSDVLNYTYKKTLPTPQNVVLTDLNQSINISWSVVYISRSPDIYVDEYELWYSDVNNNYNLKQFFVNDDGVQGKITANSITISYQQIGISTFSQVLDEQFKLQIIAKQFGYNNSEPSTEFDAIEIDYSIAAPQIVDNITDSMITWDEVERAVNYRVLIIDENITRQYTTSNTYFSYGTYLTEVGVYSIKCLAIDKNDKVSKYSNVITKQVYKKLATPKIINVTTQNDYFKIDFEEVENASNYTLYVGNQLLNSNFTIDNNFVLIASAIQYKQNGKIAFQIKANKNGYYNESEKSNISYVNVKLNIPTITISGNTITWHEIENASGYNLILDDSYIVINSAVASIDLEDYILVNVARQVRIQATSEYFDSSDISNMVYCNRADAQHEGYTDKYFYFGQTYDYYITSEQEMQDVVEYATINFLNKINVYINYDNTTTISTKLSSTINKKTGTFRLSYVASNSSSKTGKSTFTFEYAKVSDKPTYSPTYTQFDKAMTYSISESSRTNEHQFVTDKSLIEQDVYSTDGLISAVEHHVKPKFAEANTLAEVIYNKAKQILTTICDDNMTDYYKALAIHDYIVMNVSYDTYGLNYINNMNKQISQSGITDVKQFYIGYFHYVESAMLCGLAVCDGYSKMFSLLCNMEGINCIIISGLQDKEDETSGHAWNKISFDIDNDNEKECFIVDCTFDDVHGGNGTTEYAVHEYFLIPESADTKRQETSSKDYPPTTENTDMFYSASQYTPYTLPLKIDTITQGMQYLGYLSSPESMTAEALISRSIWNMINGNIPSTIGYKVFTSIYSDYVLVIAYK